MSGVPTLSEIPEEKIFSLTERLDVRGPRYTSYPTAPVWTAEFPAAPYLDALERLGREGETVAVYLHLPYCHKRCLYCGCHSFISNDEERIRKQTAAIEAEIQRAGEKLAGGARHAWLHLGGGTPTHTPPDALASLLDTLIETIPGAPGAERSVEVDPRVTTEEHLQLLADRGFTRISIGLQDFEPAVQAAVQREFSRERMDEFVATCRAKGFTSVNVDLIYGLPLQNRDTWGRTLDAIVELRPDRLAAFGYAHLPAKIKHQRAIRDEDLPGPRERLGMLIDAQRRFADVGYEAIGLDHFAVPEDKLAKARREETLWRNFMGYTDIRGLQMLGFGASAIGELDEMFVQNIPHPDRYGDVIEAGGWATTRGHRLDTDDRVRKTLINDLMCNLVVRIPDDADRVEGLRGELERAVKSLAPYEDEGLIVPRPDGGYDVTPLGQLFLRNLAMPFDRYLPEQTGVTFSRTV